VVFATGDGRKTDAADVHSVALVGTRMTGLRPLINDEQLAILRILVDRRRSLGEDLVRTERVHDEVERSRPATVALSDRLQPAYQKVLERSHGGGVGSVQRRS
jgi:hypothetical protein